MDCSSGSTYPRSGKNECAMRRRRRRRHGERMKVVSRIKEQRGGHE
jgi:hypothetical protein